MDAGIEDDVTGVGEQRGLEDFTRIAWRSVAGTLGHQVDACNPITVVQVDAVQVLGGLVGQWAHQLEHVPAAVDGVGLILVTVPFQA